jgi:hypothetical protein
MLGLGPAGGQGRGASLSALACATLMLDRPFSFLYSKETGKAIICQVKSSINGIFQLFSPGGSSVDEGKGLEAAR